MQFSERELTVAVRAAAETMMKSGAGGRKTTWDALTPYERYLVLEPVSNQVLPVLAQLPEVDVPPGTRPQFTNVQLVEAVERTMEAGGGRFRRKVALAGRVALIKSALAAMPPRDDPDSFVVPDHL